jgi:hypothetical protein
MIVWSKPLAAALLGLFVLMLRFFLRYTTGPSERPQDPYNPLDGPERTQLGNRYGSLSG